MNDREFVVILTIKKGGVTTALDVKNRLYSIIKEEFPELQINDVKEFELEPSKKGMKYNLIDSL